MDFSDFRKENIYVVCGVKVKFYNGKSKTQYSKEVYVWNGEKRINGKFFFHKIIF